MINKKGNEGVTNCRRVRRSRDLGWGKLGMKIKGEAVKGKKNTGDEIGMEWSSENKVIMEDLQKNQIKRKDTGDNKNKKDIILKANTCMNSLQTFAQHYKDLLILFPLSQC